MAFLKLSQDQELSIEQVQPGHKGMSYEFVKRVIDIVGALLGLILLFPLFLLISILIKQDDPEGTVFFKQMRVGKDGKFFVIYKFRSMVPHAEKMLTALISRNEASGAMFKIRQDPRVTRIGRFIRRTSIDELPQLINVLIGDMSLVGPRPPLPGEVRKYTRFDKQRLTVKPGCTGLWQTGGRSSVGFDEMVRLDLDYIRRRSILLDLKIILRTIPVIFREKNAC